MSLNVQNNFLANVNRMFDNHSLNKNFVDEIQREKFVDRAVSLKNVGVDITEFSKITSGFFRQFADISIPSAGHFPTHEERVTAVSKKYAEIRDALAEEFKDNEDEYYSQMEKLNLAFKGALDSTCLTQPYSLNVDVNLVAFSPDQEAERIRFKKEVARATAEYETVQATLKNFGKNLLRHVTTFYESFIQSIQTNDFDTTFQESMSLLKNSKTTSCNEIAYPDMVYIMNVIHNTLPSTPPTAPTESKEQGVPLKIRYSEADTAFKILMTDERVPYSVRKAIEDIFK